MLAPRSTSVYLLTVLLMLGLASPVHSADLHSALLFEVGPEEVGFDVSRAAGGTEVVISVDAPPDAITHGELDPNDPLVAGVAIDPDLDRHRALVRIFLREHKARTATQTLKRPFRIVLDVVHSLPDQPKSQDDEAVEEPVDNSPFRLHVPMKMEDRPLIMTPTVKGPIEGEGADAFSRIYTDYARQQYDRAEVGFQSFLDKYPDSHLAGAAAYMQADIRYQRAWTKGLAARAEMAKVYDRLMQVYPRSPNRPLSILRMAEVLMTEARWEEAKPLVDWVLSDYSNSAYARTAALMRAQIALGQNHVRTAIARFAEARTHRTDDPDGVAATFGLAEALVRMGRYAEAIHLYEEGLSHDASLAKGDVHLLKIMGRALTEAGRYTDARHVFLVLYNVFPSQYPAGVALSQVADTFRGEGLWELAERRYMDVIANYPKSEGALTARMSLADLYVDRYHATGRGTNLNRMEDGRMARAKEDELLAEALRLYGEVVKAAPSDPLSEEAIYKSARLHHEMGDGKRVLENVRELIVRNPDTHWRVPAKELAEEALATQATAYVAAGKPAAAVSLYREYERELFSPRLRGWRAHYPLALANESLGLYRDAMRHYLSLLGSQASDTFRARALYRLGGLYLAQQQPEDALKRFVYYVKRYPKGANRDAVQLRIAQSYEAMGDDARAAKAYERYINKHSKGLKQRKAKLALAHLYQRVGNIDKARHYYRSVTVADFALMGVNAQVNIDPPPAQAELWLADLEYDQQNWSAAYRAYGNALNAGLEGENRRWAELRRGQAALALRQTEEGTALLADLVSREGGQLIPRVAREVMAAAQ